jgi:uncharacterized membrane protein
MDDNTVRLFGVPVGDFGFFASLLVAVSAGFLTFFAMTFLSILGVSIYKGITHSSITLAVSYKYIAFPAGVLVLVVSLAFLMTLWVRRKMRAA